MHPRGGSLRCQGEPLCVPRGPFKGCDHVYEISSDHCATIQTFPWFCAGIARLQNPACTPGGEASGATASRCVVEVYVLWVGVRTRRSGKGGEREGKEGGNGGLRLESPRWNVNESAGFADSAKARCTTAAWLPGGLSGRGPGGGATGGRQGPLHLRRGEGRREERGGWEGDFGGRLGPGREA